MDVCKNCQSYISAMRSMIERYDKTGVIKGTDAFEEFLRFRGDDEADGLYGPATVMR